jgi:antitoxin (DNA-binding transcriptional repressor) of toxin-antitoxin stability system
MRARIVDLRYRMKDVLGALDRGESVIVLYRGKEKAKLTPIAQTTSANDDTDTAMKHPLFGMWSDRKDLADPVGYVRGLRRNRSLPADSKAADRRRK